MTPDEWDEIRDRIEQLWPQAEMEDVRSDAYFDVLSQFDGAAVARAVREILSDGSAFAPSAAQIIQKLEAPERVSFIAAWKMMAKACSSFGADMEERGLDSLRAKSPEVAEFAEAYGWRQLCHAPVNGPNGGAVLAVIERRWLEFTVTERPKLSTPKPLGEILAKAQT